MENVSFYKKIDTFEDSDKKLCYNYFNKSDRIFEVLNAAFIGEQNVCYPFGNFDAEVIYVIDFKHTNDIQIRFLKDLYKRNKRDFYSLYITPLNKCSNFKKNLIVLKSEFKIINPKKIVFITNKNISCKEYKSYSLKLDEILNIYDAILNKKKMTKELQTQIQTMQNTMKEIFYR